jgi:hypothetical protein
MAVTKYNGKDYDVTLTLKNDKGERELNPTGVRAFSINETFFEPFSDGMITISNPYNYLEGADDEWFMRGDGTDILEYELKPTGKRDMAKGARKKLKREFVIKDEHNDTADDSAAKNSKIYILIDKDKFLMQKKFPTQKKYTGFIGDILKKVIEEELGLSVGKIEKGEIFLADYIPPSHFRYLDLVYYLLRYYCYKDGDLYVKAFLMKNEEGDYELKPLSKEYFEKNKELVSDVIHTGDLANKKENNPNNIQSDEPFKRYTNDVSSITVVSPATLYTNAFHMNNLVVSYDRQLGTSHMREVRLKDVREKWKAKFVTVFKLVGGAPVDHILLEKEKIDREFKIIRLPFNIEDSEKIVTADLVNSLTFYNLEINVNIIGAVDIAPGTFIDVVKNKNDKTISDKRLLGRYLVTNVRHIKLETTYRCEAHCIKTFAGPGFDNSDSTLK